MDYLSFAILGAAIATVALWFWYIRGRSAKHDQLLKEQTRLEERVKQLEPLEKINPEIHQQLVEQQKDNARLEQQVKSFGQLENLIPKAAQQVTQQLTQQQKEKYDEHQRSFLEDKNRTLEAFKKDLKSFEETFNKAHETTRTSHVTLKQQIDWYGELGMKMSEDAKNLTQALKGSSKKQGDWGEMILESILERSGLRRDIEFSIQPSYKDEQGHEKRPDAVIHLPEKRCIIIDSKVSRSAYEQYLEFENKDQHEEAKIYLKKHIGSIQKHMKDLSEDKYHTLPKDERSLDYTVMFVPIEPAFHAVLIHDNTLFEEAWRKQIVLAGPTTLMAILHTIHSLWQITRQNQNAKTIADEAGKMYDKLCRFLGNFADIKKALDRAGSAYDEAKKQLDTGSGNLIEKAEKVKKLGARATKEIPDAFEKEKFEDVASMPSPDAPLYLNPSPPPPADDDAPASPNANVSHTR